MGCPSVLTLNYLGYLAYLRRRSLYLLSPDFGWYFCKRDLFFLSSKSTASLSPNFSFFHTIILLSLTYHLTIIMDMADHRRTSVDPPDYSDKSSFSSDEKLEEETLLRQFNGGVMHMRKKSRWINLTSRRLLIINLILSTFSTVALVTSTVLWYTRHHAKDMKDPLPPCEFSVRIAITRVSY